MIDLILKVVGFAILLVIFFTLCMSGYTDLGLAWFLGVIYGEALTIVFSIDFR